VSSRRNRFNPAEPTEVDAEDGEPARHASLLPGQGAGGGDGDGVVDERAEGGEPDRRAQVEGQDQRAHDDAERNLGAVRDVVARMHGRQPRGEAVARARQSPGRERAISPFRWEA
jgi:hypothetical protein